MQLHLWTTTEVEEHLSGPAEILRATYFGELVVTPEILAKQHAVSVSRITRRWHPEVHQVVDSERQIRRILAEDSAWQDFVVVDERLADTIAGLAEELSSSVKEPYRAIVNELLDAGRTASRAIDCVRELFTRGDFEPLRNLLVTQQPPKIALMRGIRRLRAARCPAVLHATNMLADLFAAHELFEELSATLTSQVIAVVADAGCGKSQLSAQLTIGTGDRPSGILLFGSDLQAGDSLDTLASRVLVHETPVASFAALVAAVDAAGLRAGRRLPIVIDGLNEAEDPRDWKSLLAPLQAMLQSTCHVVVICTLRSAFVPEALPEGTAQIDLPGFDHDTKHAVSQYFTYYKIDATDVELPWGLLQHPLTLRMFCEVTNPERLRRVGVEQMPGSLTALFDRYLDQVAERIAELSPRSQRYYASDVRSALDRLGLSLWNEQSRSIDLAELRLILGDQSRPWNESIVRALENDGVLIRVPGNRSSQGRDAVVFDALAGHLVADSLLNKFGGHIESWITDIDVVKAFWGDSSDRHTLASDILSGFVGLVPGRLHRKQFWVMLPEPARSEALERAAWLESQYLDNDTVAELAVLLRKAPTNKRDVFRRLFSTRSARSHPLNAAFLHDALRAMTNTDRDLRWTEWIRFSQDEIIEDLDAIEMRWRQGMIDDVADDLRARWIMWLLTSTVRLLRDFATKALYAYGCMRPRLLFQMTLESLDVSDPYVPERMLAACYGVSMAYWSDPAAIELRASLPIFATTLAGNMYAADAPHATSHTLMRDYSLGVIDLAIHVCPECITEENLKQMATESVQNVSKFLPASEITDEMVMGIEGAIKMDFGNYTIGGLIGGRSNYDFKHKKYLDVRRQIDYRIKQLGYSSQVFSRQDEMIADDAWRRSRSGVRATDRYGKKYSWIAYFEMYGVRLNQRSLPDWRCEDRTPDADIDPSFPLPPKTWQASLSDLFTNAPVKDREWLTDGPEPDYTNLTQGSVIDDFDGPWTLLDGYIEQSSACGERRVFTFLRGVLTRKSNVEKLRKALEEIDYPSSSEIPEAGSDFYTFAGEIPWSWRFGASYRNGNGTPLQHLGDAFWRHKQDRPNGIRVEVPIHTFAWEKHHSELNQVTHITVPAPALCEAMQLTNRRCDWDFYDDHGRKASLYREFKQPSDRYSSHLLYVRSDLLAQYLDLTKQKLVWMFWGQRDVEREPWTDDFEELRDIFQDFKHVHRRSSVWDEVY